MKNCKYLRLLLLAIIVLTSFNSIAKADREIELRVSDFYLNSVDSLDLKELIQQHYNLDLYKLQLTGVTVEVVARISREKRFIDLEIGNFKTSQIMKKSVRLFGANLLTDAQKNDLYNQEGEWFLTFKGGPVTVRRIMMSFRDKYLGPVTAEEDMLCGRFTASYLNNVFDTESKCTTRIKEDVYNSPAIYLGNDNFAWVNQNFHIINYSNDYICINHLRIARESTLNTRTSELVNERIESGWVCSKLGEPSIPISFGDNRGWNSWIKIRSDGIERAACLFYTMSKSGEAIYPRPFCSSHNKASEWMPLGDDRGWEAQKLFLGLRYIY